MTAWQQLAAWRALRPTSNLLTGLQPRDAGERQGGGGNHGSRASPAPLRALLFLSGSRCLWWTRKATAVHVGTCGDLLASAHLSTGSGRWRARPCLTCWIWDRGPWWRRWVGRGQPILALGALVAQVGEAGPSDPPGGRGGAPSEPRPGVGTFTRPSTPAQPARVQSPPAVNHAAWATSSRRVTSGPAH